MARALPANSAKSEVPAGHRSFFRRKKAAKPLLFAKRLKLESTLNRIGLFECLACVVSAQSMPPAVNITNKPMAAPERSLNQRMEALGKANEIRSARAQLKRDLKAGRTSIQQLLMDPPEFLETAKVFDMMLAVPKYGRVKVNKILQTCRISPSKTIGGLSDRQRAELVGLLKRR